MTDSTQNSTKRSGSRLWRWIKRLIIAGVLLTVAAVVALWLARDWLTEKAIALLDAELSKRGAHVTWGSAEYKPLRGLVLEEVTLFESAEKTTPVLTLGNVGVRVGLQRLLNERSVDAFEADISTDAASLVLSHEGKPVFTLAGLDIDLTTKPTELILNRAKGSHGDVDFNIDGRFAITKRDDQPPTLELDFAPLVGLEQMLAVKARNGKRPQLKGSFTGSRPAEPEPITLAVDGSFSGKAFSYRGVDLDDAQAAFSYNLADGLVNIGEAKANYKGGALSAESVVVDLAKERITIGSARSQADLLALAKAFGTDVSALPTALKIVRWPQLQASGTVLLADVLGSNLKVTIGGDNAFSVRVSDEQNIPLHGLAGPVALSGRQLSMPDLKASIGDGAGALKVAGGVDLKAKAPRFQGKVSAAEIPLALLLPASMKDQSISGQLQLSFNGGTSADLATLNGSAALKVTDGQLYKLPLLGMLQRVLQPIAPVFGKARDENLSANFAITNGVAHTDDFMLAGDGTLIHLRGDVNLGRQLLDVTAYARLDGAIGLATGIVTRLLEIRGTGPLSDPKLSLNKNPTDLAFNAFDGAVDLATHGVKSIAGTGLNIGLKGAEVTMEVGKKGAEAVLDVGKVGVGTAVKGAGAAVKGAGTAVKGVGKVGEGVGKAGKGILKKVIPGKKRESNATESPE